MLVLAVGSVVLARVIEHSRLGRGLAAIRDDEQAAESAGVPTLRLKLFAATLSGALMGVAGAPFPYYVSHLEPGSAFSLAIAVNAIAMPMIGGTIELGRAGDRRGAPGRRAADRDGDDFLDPQSADRRLAADRLRDFRARGDCRAVAETVAMSESLLRVENVTKRFGGFVALERRVAACR